VSLWGSYRRPGSEALAMARFENLYGVMILRAQNTSPSDVKELAGGWGDKIGDDTASKRRLT
jgi:hypothetical protein